MKRIAIAAAGSYAYNGIATVNTFWYASMYLDEPVALVVAE